MLTIDDLRDVISAGGALFLLRGSNQPQNFEWNNYGLSLFAPEEILLPSETCEVAITALAGGEFEFPEGSELVSAIYGISISKPLLKPLTIKIQHCVLLETPEQCNSLQFVRAPVSHGRLPYQFKFLPGGHFTPGSQYGSISCTQFCLIGAAAMGEDGEGQEEGEGGGEGEGQNGEGGGGGGGGGEGGEDDEEGGGIVVEKERERGGKESGGVGGNGEVEEQNALDDENGSSQETKDLSKSEGSQNIDQKVNQSLLEVSDYEGKYTCIYLPAIACFCVYRA